jgi:TetR/AcrR family fatty acid metabolism transcriptional regulator
VTLRERQLRLREDAILDAALDLFVERGYLNATMDELAARLGTSKRTLYQHFPGKEELAASLVVRAMRLTIEAFDAGGAAVSAIDRIVGLLRAGIERRQHLRAVLMSPLPGSVQSHPEYRARLREVRDRLTAVVIDAQAAGDIDPSLPAPVVAALLLGLVRERYDDVLRSGLATVDELRDTILAIVLRGLRPGPAPPMPDS